MNKIFKKIKQILYRTKDCQCNRMCKTISPNGLSVEYKHLFCKSYNFPKTLEFFFFSFSHKRKEERKERNGKKNGT